VAHLDGPAAGIPPYARSAWKCSFLETIVSQQGKITGHPTSAENFAMAESFFH
jgi:hypothetical protein